MERVEQIERFLKDQLSEEDRVKFEEQMAADASLSIDVKKYKILYDGLAELERSEIKRSLQELDPEMQESKIHRKIPWGRYLAYAASFLIILSIGLTWFANKTLSNKTLTAENFESPVSTHRTNLQNANQLQQGIQLYENGAYVQAISLLEQIQPTDDTYATSFYYQAIAHLNLQHYSTCQDASQIIIRQNDSRYRYRCEWLRILALWEKEEIRMQLVP